MQGNADVGGGNGMFWFLCANSGSHDYSDPKKNETTR